MAAKTKVESSHDVEFAEGGSTPMFSKQSAGPDKPGNTGQDQGPAPGEKFAKGGSGKMFGFSGSQSQSPGRTSATAPASGSASTAHGPQQGSAGTAAAAADHHP